MKITTNSICDDKLVELVSVGLSRVNLLVAISEIETTAVTIYDRFCASNRSTDFTLSSFTKNEEYYIFMANAVFIDIFARARLPQVKDDQALDKALFVLDNHIKRISAVTKIQQFGAALIFKSVIDKLPFSKKQCDDSAEASRYIASYPFTQRKDEPKDELRLCSNCNLYGKEGITCEDFPCDNLVSMSVSYNGMCFGFNVDPVLLGLNLPIDECDIKVFKNFLGRGCKELKKDAYNIFNTLHAIYNSEGDDDEPQHSN